MLFFFLFKQKTAYEMRISDWSSDVCSSDLPSPKTNRGAAPPRPTTLTLFDCLVTGAGVEGLSGTMAERSREGAERMTSAAKQSEIPEAVWAVGLMSGTSMDGIDAALIRSAGAGAVTAGGFLSLPYDGEMRRRLRAVIGGKGAGGEVERERSEEHTSE